MKEVIGDIWDYHKQGYSVCITTNGTVNKRGFAIMGAGVARICKLRYPEIPKLLGTRINNGGNKGYNLGYNLHSFPVKHEWYENADIDLIIASAKDLQMIIDTGMCKHPFILPRPGCGCGKLNWETEVKPAIKDILNDDVWVITDTFPDGKKFRRC